MSTNEERELGWDDPIEKEGTEFILLQDGDYDFEVVSFERGRHPGSEKLPPCNKAIVHIKIDTPEGSTTIKHQLFLHTITEGMLCAFFTAIGQREKGQKVNMNWGKVAGSKGRCKIASEDWTNDEGKTIKMNKIKKFYEPTSKPVGFEAGRF